MINLKHQVLGGISYLLSLLVFSANGFANEDKPERIPTEELIEGIKSSDGRWFEVEIIVFAHKNNSELRENFTDKVKNLAPRNSWERLQNYFYPDTHLLRKSLPQCWQEKDPFYLAEGQYQAPKSPAMFYLQYQAYQKLISSDWQISDQLCLLPSESQSPYWQVMSPVSYVNPSQQGNYHYDALPVTIQGADYDDFRDVYLIAEQNLQLTEEFDKLSTDRNTRPLLHMGWRLPGQAERVTKPFLIRAGTNFTDEFDYQGNAKPIINELEEIEDTSIGTDQLTASVQPDALLNQTELSQVDAFMQKLGQGAVVDFDSKTLVQPDNSQFPEETWELDGFIKVHLNHYLFLDAEFNYRERHTEQVSVSEYLKSNSSLLLDKSIETDLADDSGDVIISAIKRDADVNPSEQAPSDLVDVDYLKVFPLKQRRRTYSGDLHYLDHPKIGILFQIRKYRH